MEENKPTLLKSAMNVGAITGAILIIYSLITYFVGLTGSTAVGYFALVVLGFCIFYFTKTYRDKQLHGFISYGQALTFGVLIGVFASVILAFFLYLELKFIDPTLIEKQLDLMREKMLQKGMPDDQVEKAIEMSKKFATPVMSALMSILSYAFFSFLISLITSAFVKKEGTPFDSTSNRTYIIDNIEN